MFQIKLHGEAAGQLRSKRLRCFKRYVGNGNACSAC